jgi:hypothetical protein
LFVKTAHVVLSFGHFTLIGLTKVLLLIFAGKVVRFFLLLFWKKSTDKSVLSSTELAGSCFDEFDCLLQGGCAVCLAALTLNTCIDFITDQWSVVEFLSLNAYLVDFTYHRSEFAADDLVFKQHSRQVHLVVDTKIAIKQIVIQRVVEGHPVKVAPAAIFKESFHTKTDRPITLLLSANASDNNLQTLACSRLVWEKDLCLLVVVFRPLDVSFSSHPLMFLQVWQFFERIAAPLLVHIGYCRTSTVFHNRFLKRQIGRPENQAVDTIVTLHDVADDFPLINLPVLLLVKLQI